MFIPLALAILAYLAQQSADEIRTWPTVNAVVREYHGDSKHGKGMRVSNSGRVVFDYSVGGNPHTGTMQVHEGVYRVGTEFPVHYSTSNPDLTGLSESKENERNMYMVLTAT